MPWQIDPMHTQVEFSAKHFGMMTVRGRFNDVSTSGTSDHQRHHEAVSLNVQRYGEINDQMMAHRVSYGAEGQINRKDLGMEFDMFADNRLIVSH
jgi:polyisoprenoid-binding protein YceI